MSPQEVTLLMTLVTPMTFLLGMLLGAFVQAGEVRKRILQQIAQKLPWDMIVQNLYVANHGSRVDINIGR